MKKESVYKAINERLHEADMKKAVKDNDWKKVVDTILPMFNPKDSGRYGKIFEIVVKLYLNGYKGNSCIVSAKGKVDVTYKGEKIEVKSNCGELDDIKAKTMIYTMENTIDVYQPGRAVVITTEKFFGVLESENLIKVTKKTSGYTKHNIQTYRNSKRRYTKFENGLMMEMLDELADWK